MKMKFKVGYKVNVGCKIGEVVYFDRIAGLYLVGIHGFHGHNGNGWIDKEISIQAGYEDECFWFNERDLKPIDEGAEIVISKHGKEVRAVFKVNGKVVKESVAKCHPEDRFNFKTGAKLAFERLFEKQRHITFREMLKKEHPKLVSEHFTGGCLGCPSTYGYSNMNVLTCGTNNEESCRKCWDREYIPKEKK